VKIGFVLDRAPTVGSARTSTSECSTRAPVMSCHVGPNSRSTIAKPAIV